MNLMTDRLRGRHAPARERVSMAVVELDRWQVTGLAMLMLALTAGAFFIGVRVGESKNPTAVPKPALSLTPKVANTQERHMALADVWPPTQEIDRDLARPLNPPLPSDPTERARAQAHQQLQESRSAGLRNDAPIAPAPPVENPPMVLAAGGSGYTLQVSLFDTQATANSVASQLLDAGHPVRIREVQSADGRSLFRVEVGQFDNAESASNYQRRFERDSGYSGVLVPL